MATGPRAAGGQSDSYNNKPFCSYVISDLRLKMGAVTQKKSILMVSGRESM